MTVMDEKALLVSGVQTGGVSAEENQRGMVQQKHVVGHGGSIPGAALRVCARGRTGKQDYCLHSSLTIITSLFDVWITFVKCQRPMQPDPPKQARSPAKSIPKLTSIGKSDLSARPNANTHH